MEPISIRYFREVAKHGSVRHAAEKLFLAQSAVSRQITLLESELSVRLFERHARGMTLTEAGHLLIAYSDDIRYRFEELRGDIQEYENLQHGHVEIVCIEGLLSSFMPNAICIFADECAGISISVTVLGSHAIAEAIAEHRYDLGIVFGSSHRIDLLELAKMNQPLCVIVSPGHPLANRGNCTLSEVTDFHVVLPDRSFGIRQLIDKVCVNGKFTLHKMVETNTLTFARGVVIQSNSHVTFLTRDMVLPEIEAGTLVAVPLSDPTLRKTDVTLVASRTRKLSKAASHMAQHLTKLMNGSRQRKRQ
jgi:DNA-binding transcriptional LysR family regulator